MSQLRVSFGALLRRYRTAAGLTQEALAERSGLSVRGISDLERGARSHPHQATVSLLVAALALADLDRDALIGAARETRLAEPESQTRYPSGVLPTSLTSLIGRGGEIRDLHDLLLRDHVRLVTLTGPGGVGKTRLAIEVARSLHDAFADGVCFVSLAPLRDPSLVGPSLANALGISETSDLTAFERVAAYLHQRELLLLLDNFEHLLDSATLVNDLLLACPRLKILATSRALLRLTAEVAIQIPPLALAEDAANLNPERMLAVPAAALFIERRSAVMARTSLDEADATAIHEICERLDGLPLAIELAAVRSRHMSLRELNERLGHRLPLLTSGPRDLLERHRTLRDTIAWSYDLLTPNQQQLMRGLSVFAGGWTLRSAEELEAGPGRTPENVMDDLTALIEGSLVEVLESPAGTARYRFLETIREFAAEHLDQHGERREVSRRMALVMRDFTARAERGLQSGERTVWSRLSVDELDNVRAALRWSLEEEEPEIALAMIGNVDWFWDAVARDLEGWSWCQKVLGRTDIDTSGIAYARAISTAGAIAWNVGDFSRSAQLLSEGVDRLRGLSDRRSLAQALINLALTQLYLGNVEQARLGLIEAVDLYSTVDDPWGRALALFGLGEVLARADPSAAHASYASSLALFRSIDESWGIAHAMSGLAGIAMLRGDYTAARALMEDALQKRRTIGNQHAIATSLVSLGELARREGDLERAAMDLEEGLARFRDVGDAEHIAWALNNLGLLYVELGEGAQASRCLSECLELRVRLGNPDEIANVLSAVARLGVLIGLSEDAAQLEDAARISRMSADMKQPDDNDDARLLRELAEHGIRVNDVETGLTPDKDDAIALAHAILQTGR